MVGAPQPNTIHEQAHLASRPVLSGPNLRHVEVTPPLTLTRTVFQIPSSPFLRRAMNDDDERLSKYAFAADARRAGV